MKSVGSQEQAEQIWGTRAASDVKEERAELEERRVGPTSPGERWRHHLPPVSGAPENAPAPSPSDLSFRGTLEAARGHFRIKG